MPKLLFILVLVFSFSYASAEDTDVPDTTGINSARLAVIGGSIAVSYTTVYLIYLKEGWWSESNGFFLKNDFEYASNLDKFGHFYAGAFVGELFAMSYDWAGMSPFASALWAGITVGLTQILVEFKDGFSPYGYSVFDAVAGSLGGFYAMGKRFIPAMQYVDYKFTYFPNYRGYWEQHGEDVGGSLTGGNGVFVDDYYGGNQTHWLSFKVAKMLPNSTRDYYPQWLALAFGWGIDENRFSAPNAKSRYEFYISPDYDFEAIVRPQKTWSKNAVKILNFIKFPAPVFCFGRDFKLLPLHPWYGVSFVF